MTLDKFTIKAQEAVQKAQEVPLGGGGTRDRHLSHDCSEG